MRNKLALIFALASFGRSPALASAWPGPRSRPPGASHADHARAGRRLRPLAAAARLRQRRRRRRRRPRRPRDPDCLDAATPNEAPLTGAGRPTSRGRSAEPRAEVRAGRLLERPHGGDRPAAVGAPQREPRRRAVAAHAAAPSGPQRHRRRPAAGRRDRDGGSQYNDGGAPTDANPTTTIAPFGPAPIGVPNFVIDSFEIPPFLLPIYQACGTEYGIPWEVLASINKIETGFGTNLSVSSAGAIGWMQFMPSSWEAYGRRRQRRRPQGPLQPGRRDLRRRQLPEGRPAAKRISTTRSSPTTTPTGTCRRCCSTPAPTASCRPIWSAR